MIFALFVMFSLFIGCGDEGETLKPSATEWETRSLVLLAPGEIEDQGKNLKVGLDYAVGSAKEFTIREEDGTFKILIGENTYVVTITSNNDGLEILNVTYTVTCTDGKDRETDKCNSCEIIISEVKVDGKTWECPPDKETGKFLCNKCTINNIGNLKAGSKKEIEVVVKLDKVPPIGQGIKAATNEVCVEYKIPWY